MPFLLSRGGNNIPAEVQRWQYFLRRLGISQAGSIDADFGIKTETATKFFQVSHGISATGKVNEKTLEVAQGLGYTILPNDYYKERAGPGFPAKPTNLTSPSNATRNKHFTCFRFLLKHFNVRPDREAIVQKGSCDGSISDWAAAHIVSIKMPQLQFARGFGGTVTCHKLAADPFTALFRQWEKDDLLHLIRTYEGCFVPRYKRGIGSLPMAGHGLKSSSDVENLSNHAFGSAFDINLVDNELGKVPAFCGRRGSVRELVASASKLGIFWGGFFGRQDGMHFEISKV
ncbi:MAG TPA: M15 family metallopeptidase [Longimicrobium sp.]|jgi:hypothetical protein